MPPSAPTSHRPRTSRPRVRAPSLVPSDSQLAQLTNDERAVLSLLGLGLSNRAVAAETNRSLHTVQFHLRGLRRKLLPRPQRAKQTSPSPAEAELNPRAALVAIAIICGFSFVKKGSTRA